MTFAEIGQVDISQMAATGFFDLFMAYVLYLWLVMGILPAKIADIGPRDDHAKAIARLETLARLPTLMGDTGRVPVLFHLASRYVVAQRYSDAMPYLRRLIALPFLPQEMKPLVHGRYGDCCEALGRRDEAERHRQIAVGVDKADTYETVVARGAALDRERRAAEACALFAQAIDVVKCGPAQRNDLRLKLGLAAINAGRPEAARQAVEQVLADDPEQRIAVKAHRTAALAYKNLGDLEKAEAHYRAAQQIAESAGDRARQAEMLAGLSDVERRRGNLLQALAMAQEAFALHHPPTRVTSLYLSEAYFQLVRYEEAWGAISGERDGVMFTARHQRLLQSIDCITLSSICVECGRYDDASRYLQQAADGFQGDQKMAVGIRASGAVILAHQGLMDQAQREIDWVAETLTAMPLGRSTQIDSYFQLVRASYLVGNHDACMRYLDRCQELKPYADTRPRILSFAAESCLHVGDRDTARALFAEAAGACPESPWAQKAQERLLQI